MTLKVYSSLSLVEISFYIVTWICGVCIACHSLYVVSQEKGTNLRGVNFVIPSPWWQFWTSTLIKKDGTDYEWETWKMASYKVGVLMVIYPILSQFCKLYSKYFALLFSAIYSVIVTMYLIGLSPVIFLFLQIIVIWAAYQTNSAKAVWMVAIAYLICLQFHPLKTIRESLIPDKHFLGPLIYVFLTSMNLRCISFALDRIWGNVSKETGLNSLLMLTAFSFYLPLMLFGPFTSSKTFKDSFEKPLHSLDWSFLMNILKQTARYAVWFTVTDVSLYFMFQHAFRLQPYIVTSLDQWALCGMGYFMLLYFQTKYTVFFGWTGFLARLDSVDAPPHPRCFGRIHLYSDVWRYFDNGLHLFMKQYIFLPVQTWLPASRISSVCASAACFSFVFVWHGISKVYLFWSILSFLCITCENLFKSVSRNTTYQQWESYCFGHRAVRRLHALLASPLLLIGHLNSLYLLFGLKIGHIYMERILLEFWPWGLATIIFFLYCGCQTSIEMRNYEIKKQLNADKVKDV